MNKAWLTSWFQKDKTIVSIQFEDIQKSDLRFELEPNC